MAKLTIEILVDWGRSFVDTNGNFYCGTTQEQKDTAARVISHSDLDIFVTDLNTRKSKEFIVNGGPYPTHNLPRKFWYDLDKLGVKKGQTVSPELTETLNKLVKDKPSGLIVPRHVFFQDYDGDEIPPAFSFKDVEDTFGVKRLDDERFLDGEIKYVINAKHMFDGTKLKCTRYNRGSVFERLYDRLTNGVPTEEYNVFTLLQKKYGLGSGLRINHTGVVAGICIFRTASGAIELFPKAEVNIIADGISHLLIKELGFEDEKYANNAIKSMSQQYGINYITSKEYLGSR